jgi:hypothetical protein
MIAKSLTLTHFLKKLPSSLAVILEDAYKSKLSHIKIADLTYNLSYNFPYYLLQGCNQAQDPATPGSPPCGVDQDPSLPAQPPQHMANIPPPTMLSGATPIRAPAPIADQHKVHKVPYKASRYTSPNYVK